MDKITSTSNQKIKYVQKLRDKAKFRREEKLFLVEGKRMVFEADPSRVREVFVSEDYRGFEEAELLNHFPDTDIYMVTSNVFKAMGDTQTPQGILAVVEQQTYDISDMLKGEDTLLLLLEDIQDPGNLGTMIRTGEGAGVTGIITSQNTVDIYSPKTVRSTMGSLYRVPVVSTSDFLGTIKKLQEKGVTVHAAHLGGKDFYDRADYKKASAFLIGNEGNGLKDETANMADVLIKIPMEGQVESLNAAIAATLLIYEAHRQRGL